MLDVESAGAEVLGEREKATACIEPSKLYQKRHNLLNRTSLIGSSALLPTRYKLFSRKASAREREREREMTVN